MNQIKLVYGQHYNNYRIPDCYFLLLHSLLSQGISAHLVSELTPGYTNIIVEGFSKEFVNKVIELKKHKDSKLFIICTEYLTEGTFNNFPEQSVKQKSSHYDQNEYWLERFSQLKKIIPFCNGLFHLSELQVETYKKQFPTVDTLYLPHGAIESLKIPYSSTVKKDIDVLFTGVLTRYRKNTLNKIQSYGLKVQMCDTNTPEYLRADLTRRSKIALNLLQKESWLHPSNSRFHYHLTNCSFLISETTKFKCDLSEYILEAEREDLPELILDSLKNDRYLDKAKQSHKRFFSEMNMNQFMPKILSYLEI